MGNDTNREAAAVQAVGDYTVGFCEFDDQGWLWDRGQINAITNQFYAESKTNGLLIVTFVHGWMHDASSADASVQMFKAKILRPLATMEAYVSKKQHRTARRVVGVYVGWRGLSESIPYLNLGTFWNRKDAAERVGHGAVLELFCELERLKKVSNHEYLSEIKNHTREDTKLIIVGHSFGGDIVYSAVAPVLIERMVESAHGARNEEPPRSLGDIVVLINPAIEAARFETLHRLARTRRFPPGTSCMLAIFTSKADLATKCAFPAGRFLSTIPQAHRDNEQAAANRTAIGHYAPYQTFDLVKRDKTTVDEDAGAVDRILMLRQQMTSASANLTPTVQDLTYKFTHCELDPRTNSLSSSPVFVVSVDPKIIPDHGTIDRGVFTRFLAEFLATLSEDQ
jgi:hypothetical protein